MRKLIKQAVFLSLFVLVGLLVTSRPFAQSGTGPLQPYTRTMPDTAQLALTLVSNGDSAVLVHKKSGRSWTIRHTDLRREGNQFILGNALFTNDSVLVANQDTLLKWRDVSSVEVTRSRAQVSIAFFSQTKSSPASRIRRGNIVAGTRTLFIDTNGFTRGSVATLGGDIVIGGEVNGDVFAMAGNVTLKPTALVRGSVVSIFGKVEIEDGARCYGEILSGARGHRRVRTLETTQFKYLPILSYDRVDGLAMGGEVRFPHPPTRNWKLHADLSYAFASDRVRGGVGASLQLNRKQRLSIDVDGYRRLTHDDDGLTTRLENSFLSLSFKQDLWDWYEADGGSVAIRLGPMHGVTAALQYRRESTNWLPARQNLWSIAGGSGGGHLFRENFSTIWPEYDSTSADSLPAAVASSSVGEISLSAEFMEHPEVRLYESSGWTGSFTIDYGDHAFGANSSYRRVSTSIWRYQHIARNLLAMARMTAATSNGDLPAYRVYSIGGIATLPGYPLRSQVADAYLLGKLEIRASLKSKLAALGLSLDGAIINGFHEYENRSLSDIGLTLYLSALLHVTVASPLGPGNDGKLRTWLSFRHNF